MERNIETLKRDRSSAARDSGPRADSCRDRRRPSRHREDRSGLVRPRLRVLRGPRNAPRLALPRGRGRIVNRGLPRGDPLPRDVADRVRVLRRGGSAGAGDGLGTGARAGIAPALPISRSRPGVCRRAEGQRSVDAFVRVPRVRAGRRSGPVAVVPLARALGPDADALGSPRNPPRAHFHRPPSRVASRGPPGLVMAGSSLTHGWIIDAYGDYDRDSIVLWLWNERGGAHRIEDPRVVPTFFLHASPSELPAIRRRIEILDGVRDVREVQKRIALEDDEPKPVLEIVPRHYRDIRNLAHILDSNGGYVDHRLFNVDLRFSQRYAIEHDIFPMGLMHYANGVWRAEEEHLALDYPLPALRKSLLYLPVDNPAGLPPILDPRLRVRVDDVAIEGDEETILKGIDAVLRSKDPDVLMTDGGDAFLMPYLAAKASELCVNLQLGRDPDRFAGVKPKSYFTYGKIVYKPGQYILRGRLHLDRGHFAFRESDFAGLAELSRLSTLTPQEQARLTPGTAFSAMQVDQAYHDWG